MDEQIEYSGNFPSHNIDPKKKDTKEWIGEYGKAIFIDNRRAGSLLGYKNRAVYNEIILYAQGKQSIDQYKEWMNKRESKESATSFLNLDFRILNMATKYVNIILKKMRNVGYGVNCTVLDKLAIDRKNEYAAQLQVASYLKKHMGDSIVPLESLFGEEIIAKIPDSREELEVELSLNYKDKLAMDMEIALESVKDQNEFNRLVAIVDRDLVHFGIGGTRTYLDTKGRVKIKRVNPYNLIVSNSNQQDFDNLSYAGEVISMPFGEFKEYAGDAFTEKEYRDIEEYYRAQGKYEYSYDDDIQSLGRNSKLVMVEVFDFCFLSADEHVYELTKDDESKRRKINKKPYNYERKNKNPKKRVSRLKYETVYTGKILTGCWKAFACKRMTNIEREKTSLGKAKLPYHLYAPNMEKGRTVSVVEIMIPALNMIQWNWLKAQQELAQARPGSGVMLDLDALEKISMGKGGKDFTVKEIYNLFESKNILIYRGKSLNNGQLPIKDIPETQLIKYQEYINGINMGINFLRGLSGVNEFVDSSTPKERTGLGVANIAIEGAENALGFLFDAKKDIFTQTMKSCANLIQDSVKFYGDMEGVISMKDVLGESTIQSFKITKDISLTSLGIEIENLPTEQEWQDFYMTLTKMFDANQIAIEDLIFIKQIKNFKQAQNVLILRQRKRMKEQQEISQQQIEANTQAQMQSAEQASRMEFEAKQALEQIKAEVSLALQKMKGEQKLNEIQADNYMKNTLPNQ